jgi:hypothetical protein
VSIHQCIQLSRALEDEVHTTHVRPKERGHYRPPTELASGKLELAHRTYLYKRGISPDEAEAIWGVKGLNHLGGRLAWRLFMPVTLRGVPVSWTTRSINHDCPMNRRYIAAKPDEEAIPLHDLLYGGDLVRWAVIVTEGPMDAMRVGPGAVCLMGNRTTNAQLAALGTVPVRAIVLDSEPAAQRRARKLADMLSLLPGRTERVTLETGKDPCAASRREIRELRKRYLN